MKIHCFLGNVGKPEHLSIHLFGKAEAYHQCLDTCGVISLDVGEAAGPPFPRGAGVFRDLLENERDLTGGVDWRIDKAAMSHQRGCVGFMMWLCLGW